MSREHLPVSDGRGYFRDLVKKEGLSDKIEVDSAGIGPWHSGDAPHEGTRKILDRQDISYDGMKARQIHTNDWHRFDYMIAMDDDNIRALQGMTGATDGAVVARLMDYVHEAETANVPDPYFTGNFDYTYELVSDGCKQLLNQIKTENNT